MNYKTVINYLIESDYRKIIEKQCGIKLYAELQMNPITNSFLIYFSKN